MVCRMFHPTNGRNNFDGLICTDLNKCTYGVEEMEEKEKDKSKIGHNIELLPQASIPTCRT